MNLQIVLVFTSLHCALVYSIVCTKEMLKCEQPKCEGVFAETTEEECKQDGGLFKEKGGFCGCCRNFCLPTLGKQSIVNGFR